MMNLSQQDMRKFSHLRKFRSERRMIELVKKAKRLNITRAKINVRADHHRGFS